MGGTIVLILAFNEGDGVLIDLPDGEQAKIVLMPRPDPHRRAGRQRKIGFEFPKRYSITRIDADGERRTKKGRPTERWV
jgi:hypothetical protein